MKKAAKRNQVGKAKGKAVKLKKVKKELKPEGAQAKSHLGKFARGGSAKHKTQVNVIVGGGKQPVPVPVPAPGAAPGMSPPAAMPSPRPMPPGAAPMPAPGPGMMPAGRPGMKTGGKVKKVPSFEGGAGGGLGRLEKAEHAKKIK